MEHGAKHGAIICCYSASSPGAVLVENNGAFIAIMYSLHVFQFHPLLHNSFLPPPFPNLSGVYIISSIDL